jgi:hypothetical protein
MRQADASALSDINQRSQVNLLGYKHIPAPDGSTDAGYPIVTPMDVATKELWTGESGHIFYGDLREQDVGFIKPLITALQALPMKQFVSAVRTIDSVVLRTDLSRRLH